LCGVQIETKDHATPFVNGTRGGGVSDSSGYENTGTFGNSAPHWIESSKVGSGAYEFDGSNDSIDLPPKSIPTGNEVTVSFWSYGGPNQPTSDSILEAENSSNNRVLNIHHPWGDGTIYWDTNGGGTGRDRIYKSADPSDYKGRWAHWTFTKDANTGDQKIYLDGQLWHSGTGKTGIIGTTDVASLGSYADGDQDYWEGKVDDFRIYATALSASVVQEVYEQRASIDSGGNFHSHEVEEPDERKIIEDSTETATARLIGEGTTPIDTDYSAWVESDDTLGNVFLEGWVHLTNSSIHPDRFEFTKDNNNKGIAGNAWNEVNWSVGWNRVWVDLSPYYDSPSNTPWSNMDRFETYVNTEDSSESIRFKNIRLRKYPDNDPVEDMSLQDGGTLRTNSISEVGPGADSLVGWWPLDGNTRDYAGSANGTNNGASITSGLGQSAYNFTGTDPSDVDLPQVTELAPKKAVTAILWANPDTTDSTQSILLTGRDNNSGIEFRDDRLQVNCNSGEFKDSISTLNTGEWTHMVLTYESGVGGKTYVNGSESGSTGDLGDIVYPEFYGSAPTIGSHGGLYNFDGKIQDVRLYNRALTSEEVENLYNITDPRSDQRVIQSIDGEVYTKNQFDETL
jgi:hypothetical protein